jgi:uncharacterized protein (DUF697 family)
VYYTSHKLKLHNEYLVCKVMVKYCRDQARDELWLMMGGGAAAGAAGGVPILGALAFQTSLTAVQVAVVTRISKVYGVDLIPGIGAGAAVGAIMAMGGSQLLFRIAGGVAGVIPGVGGLIQPGIGAGAVKAFGEAAIAYFEQMYPNKIYSA